MTSSANDLSDSSVPDERQNETPAKGNFAPGMAPAVRMMPPGQPAEAHTMGQRMYPYVVDPYYGSLIAAAYGGQAMMHPHTMGLPLQTDAVEEPVYVNAKQYHGILRRRQSRAKAESENKLIKNRKPYLHESRHLHALKRARGCGGRFEPKGGDQQDKEDLQNATTNASESNRVENPPATSP